jgi:hypothetical protein
MKERGGRIEGIEVGEGRNNCEDSPLKKVSGK